MDYNLTLKEGQALGGNVHVEYQFFFVRAHLTNSTKILGINFYAVMYSELVFTF